MLKPEDAENRAGTPVKQLSFFTAAKIAKWMAKSYGYRAAKKHEYTSQDQARASQIHLSLLDTIFFQMSNGNFVDTGTEQTEGGL